MLRMCAKMCECEHANQMNRAALIFMKFNSTNDMNQHRVHNVSSIHSKNDRKTQGLLRETISSKQVALDVSASIDSDSISSHTRVANVRSMGLTSQFLPQCSNTALFLTRMFTNAQNLSTKCHATQRYLPPFVVKSISLRFNS